ncbi:MAG: hypothetical protein ABJB16_03270 [Saprospiraceae bacterium]
MRVIASFLITYFLSVAALRADVHVVIYATYHGHTGHCGIAIDDYRISVLESVRSGLPYYYNDTINTGALTYYDFWPLKDLYKGRYDGDVDPIYYKLPSARWKQMISLKTLADQGVPHKFGYPCDALVSIPTTKQKDFELMEFLDKKIVGFKSFNSMQYNCCDFVAEALTHLTGRQIEAREFIVKDFVTTPNELYKTISRWKDVRIVKDPGEKINGTFFQERIIARLQPLLSIFKLLIIIPNSL